LTVTPDGKSLIFREQTPPAKPGSQPGWDLMLLTLGAERQVKPLWQTQTPFSELNAEVSPNGLWLAYQSNEEGQDEVYVVPFPKVEDRKQKISTNGGTQPLWAHNGRELFYVAKNTLMRVPLTITSTSTVVPGNPSKVVAGSYRLTLGPGEGTGRQYDISQDDQRFLMIKGAKAPELEPSPRIILVQNWFEGLRARVPAR
jgi:serine/threonine-protein kinase